MSNYTKILFIIGIITVLYGCTRNSPDSPTVILELLESTTSPPSFIKDFWLSSEEFSGVPRGSLTQLCIILDFEKLLVEQDQNLQGNDHYARISMQVWKTTEFERQLMYPVLMTKLVQGPSIVDNNGNQLGETTFCWSYELPLGLYAVDFSYRQPSGNILSHQWNIQNQGEVEPMLQKRKELVLQDFEFVHPGIPCDEILAKVGTPDRTSIYVYEYELNNGEWVMLRFSGSDELRGGGVVYTDGVRINLFTQTPFPQLTIRDFNSIVLGETTYDEVIKQCGEPATELGTGQHIARYILANGQNIWLILDDKVISNEPITVINGGSISNENGKFTPLFE